MAVGTGEIDDFGSAPTEPSRLMIARPSWPYFWDGCEGGT